MCEQNTQVRLNFRLPGNYPRNSAIRIIALALLLSFALPSTAQVFQLDITPQPATPDDEIRLFVALPIQSCFNELTDYAISIDGASITVNFVVEQVSPPPFCGTPPPVFLDTDLGSFEPGRYQLQITGMLPEDPFEPVSTEFEVLLGNSATAVPALSPTALVMMLAIIAIAGVISLRRARQAAL